ncbi:NAD(P)H-dependent glycerol-3-phosphate dehydrogenase [Legionella dresdenensis]|uniref:Glycerol-3-phosphate dehydrogenase [NAD(P)+] n=1 Tax=Legionella dresdenensis TaxID=450200 RepID=A0ABV8CEM5_9GAMM
MSNQTVAILGAGSWGTAVAIHLATIGNRTLLWGHRPQQVEVIKKERANQFYLPGVEFPALLQPTSDLAECMQADYLIIAVPSHAFAQLLSKLEKPANGIAWLTKGLDPESNELLSHLVASKWGAAYPAAIISGPSFAREVARLLPTALTIASNNAPFQQQLHQLIHQANIRAYLSNDMIGVQLCGAVKNVLAIACGISDGLGYGANAKAALITRGLAEMSRLGQALGARQETFLGLAGVGDLVLTCTDDQSRNRRFGLLIGQGINKTEAADKIGQVVEGAHNALQVHNLAGKVAVEMPICTQIKDLLEDKITPSEAVNNLMSRSARAE